jgi:oxygen-independent coproporphyrinogen-3 oxidase
MQSGMVSAVYIHIPYCVSKCPYCDFVSIPADNSIAAYLDSLCHEITKRCSQVSATKTIYIGGGTPTVLSPEQISRLLLHLKRSFQISPAAEVTVEGNPCSISSSKVEALVSGGVNRMSIGAQSFTNAELRSLGRMHNCDDIHAAVSILRDGGIDNINLDLMFGIPGQTVETWRYSLDQALSLEPAHISVYCLTFEPGTRFDSLLKEGALQKKSEDEELEFYDAARETLTAAGYEHYEISNFAISGKRSAHNLVYWSNEEYLGLGASAVSYLGGKRITNLRAPAEYISAMNLTGESMKEVDEIPPSMQAIETMIQRLRLCDDIDCAAFSSRFGIHPIKLFGNSFDDLIREGFIKYRGEALSSTLRGWQLANEVAMKLLP